MGRGRGVRQPKRAADFYQQNINPEAVRQMSEFCREAHIIYDLWDNGKGADELRAYLLDNVGCSADEMETICEFYKPEKQPDEVCPIEVINHKNFNDVFAKLALQLPSFSGNKKGAWPKNLLAWVLMRKVYGKDTFDFVLDGSGQSGRDNKIFFPRIMTGPDGNPIPFGLAAINAIKVGELPASVVKKAEILKSNLGQIGIDFAKMLLESDLIFPPNKTLQQIIDVIKRGMKGETVILTGAFCPDYAYRESTGNVVQYEYTFDSVGAGVGLVAQQFVRVLPFLVKFFDQKGIKYRVKLGIGDFEANSDEILKSVGVSREEFVLRCLMSLDAFRRALPGIDVEVCLFEQQWANGRWQKYIKEAHAAMLSGNFGQMKTNTGKDPRHEVEFIAKDSASFYQRWYNRPDMTIGEIINLVVGQGAEYVAMGRVLKDDFGDQPFIQVAGDRPKMQIFNSFSSNHPTLCCKRVY